MPLTAKLCSCIEDIKEVWEGFITRQRRKFPSGIIHDFKYREGSFMPSFSEQKRTQLEDYLDDFYFTQGYDEVMGASQ